MYGLPDNAVVGFAKRGRGMVRRANRNRVFNDAIYQKEAEAILKGVVAFAYFLRKFPIFQTAEYKAELKKEKEQG